MVSVMERVKSYGMLSHSILMVGLLSGVCGFLSWIMSPLMQKAFFVFLAIWYLPKVYIYLVSDPDTEFRGTMHLMKITSYVGGLLQTHPINFLLLHTASGCALLAFTAFTLLDPAAQYQFAVPFNVSILAFMLHALPACYQMTPYTKMILFRPIASSVCFSPSADSTSTGGTKNTRRCRSGTTRCLHGFSRLDFGVLGLPNSSRSSPDCLAKRRP